MIHQARTRTLSFLAGMLFTAAVVALMSQTPVTPTFPSARFQYGPQPRDFVRIVEGTPYTVPTDMVLIVTALGAGASFTTNQNVSIRINGSAELSAFPGPSYGFPATLRPAPRQLVAPPGATVEVVGGDAAMLDAKAIGYLSSTYPAAPVGTLRPILTYEPLPQHAFMIREGTPFIVPPGKLCVVTALGVADEVTFGGTYGCDLRVNGQLDIRSWVMSFDPTASSMNQLPSGVVFPEGAVLEANYADNPNVVAGRAWCYLADA